MQVNPKAIRFLISVFVIALYVLLWELYCRWFNVSINVLPTPTRIVAEICANLGYYLSHTWLTFQIIVVGFGAALLLAPPIAYAVHKSKWADRILAPLIVLTQVVPKPALIPLLIIWFAFTRTPNYLITFLISFYPIFADTLLGLRRIKKEYLQMMDVWGATSYEKICAIEIPFIRPFILSSLKVASLYAVIGAITSEILLSKDGIGYVIQFAANNGNMDKVFGGIVISSILGMCFYYSAVLIEKKAGEHV